MDRREFLAASAIGTTAAIAGCTSSATDDDDPGSDDDGSGTTGAASETAMEREIAVSANGEVETDPDKAVVSVGIEASGDEADEVNDELADRAEQLRDAFDEFGIPDENVEEGQYRVHPVRGNEVEGFEGTHSFQVELDDVDRVGEFIDTSIDAGADNVGRVNFTLQDETEAELRNEAIDAAFDNADEEATYIAENRDVSLAGVVSVSTTNVNTVPVRYDVADDAVEADDAAATGTEIDADPVTVSASVEVVYGFEDAD
ncbi:SIMPL domain-containing protein [Natrialbaceae archaeon A-arb3/5]